MDQDRIDVQFGAKTDGLKAGSGQAATIVAGASDAIKAAGDKAGEAWGGLGSIFGKVSEAGKEAGEGIKGAFSSAGSAIASVQAPLLAIAAIVGGGAFFKSAISESISMTGEATKLSRALGITVDEASALNTALGDIYTDSGTYVDAFQKFAKQIKTNEEGLNGMGLATRDANGNLKDSNELFREAVAMVGTYKPGLDQTTAAMTLFGRGVDDVMKLQKLNNKVIEEAREKNEALGLTISQENVAASKAYKAAMNDVHDVLSAVTKVVGDAVMPAFTELAQYFAETGPTVVAIFRGAMTGLMLGFRGLQVIVKVVAEGIFELFNTLIDSVGLAGQVMVALMSGRFREAASLAVDAGARIGQGFKRAFVTNVADAVTEAQEKFQADMTRIWGGTKADQAPAGGTKTMGEFKTPKETKDTSRVPEWEAELAERKVAIERQALLEGQYRQMSLEDELKYWQTLRDSQDLNATERIAITRKTAETELALIKQGFDVKVATLQAEAAAYKNNTEERTRIELQIQALYAQGTKEYADAQKKLTEIARQAAEQQRQIREISTQEERDARLNDIALQQQQMQLQEQLGIITRGELLDAERSFESQRNEIALSALQQRLQAAYSDPDRNPVLVAQINAQIEALAQQHAQRMGQISNQAVIEQNKDWMGLFGNMQSGFASVIKGFLSGTQSLAQTVRGLFNVIANAIEQTLANIAARWLVQQITERIMGRVTAVGQVASNAAVAGSGAFAATAAIPFVGPELAPAAAAAAYSGALSFAGLIPAAAQGFDVPRGLNPITQLHSEEMVLPAKHASVIRGMADGDAGGGDRNVEVTINAQPMRGNFFLVHGDDLKAAIKQLHRNFAFAGASR